MYQPDNSVDFGEDALSRVGVMVHQKFNSLRINSIRALHVVFRLHVGHAVSQALLKKVLFGVACLVLDNVEGHHRLLEAGNFEFFRVIVQLHVRLVQAQVVLGLSHSLCGVIDLSQPALVKCFLHCFNSFLASKL